MNQIHYCVQDWGQLPAGLDWLTPAERQRHDAFRFEKRRRDWLLGRWTAKMALLEYYGLPDKDVIRCEIATAPDGAPRLKMDGKPCRARLSLSHSNGRALAAVASDTTALGCDIERVEPRVAGFVDTYFTAAEVGRIERTDPRSRDLFVTMIWSAKESTLKALRTGLRVDTRSVEVIVDEDRSGSRWTTARTIAMDREEFDCKWRCDGEFVLSIVTRPAVRTVDRRSAAGRIQFPEIARV